MRYQIVNKVSPPTLSFNDLFLFVLPNKATDETTNESKANLKIIVAEQTRNESNEFCQLEVLDSGNEGKQKEKIKLRVCSFRGSIQIYQLQPTSTYFSLLQPISTHLKKNTNFNPLQPTSTYFNPLQPTSTHPLHNFNNL